MNGVVEVENLVKKLKITQILSTYLNTRRKNLVYAMDDGRHLQVAKSTEVLRKILFAKGLLEFLMSFYVLFRFVS